MEAKISSSSGKEQVVDLRIRTLTTEEKKKNALKIFGICWGLSFACLPLPPIHWVLTPLFFFAGPVMAWRKFQESKFIEPLSFTCPECGKEMSLNTQTAVNPKKFTCKHCGYFLKLTW